MRTIFIFIFAIGVSISVEADSSKSSHGFMNYETSGNLKSEDPLKCVDLDKMDNLHTPADIYPGVAKCISSSEFVKAARLFAIAGVYGTFDMLRVSDQTAHQAVQVLQANNIFSSLTSEQQKALRAALSQQLGQDDNLVIICAEIRKIGIPNYYPAYMIQHGMGAVLGHKEDQIVKDFDAPKAFESALASYLHCK